MSNGKADEGKNRLDLVFPSLIEEVGRIRTYGTQKYGDSENWRFIDNPVQRYTAAAMRHFEAFRKGEYFDFESGLPHLAHCACNLMFLLELTKDKEGIDILKGENTVINTDFLEDLPKKEEKTFDYMAIAEKIVPKKYAKPYILEKNEVKKLNSCKNKEKSCSKCVYEKLSIEYEPCRFCIAYDRFTAVPEELVCCQKCMHNEVEAWEEPCVTCVNLSNFVKKDEK